MMDPNLFHVDWDQLFEVMAAVVVLILRRRARPCADFRTSLVCSKIQ